MITIKLSEREVQLLYIGIQRKEKHLRESHRNNEKNGRTECMSKNVERMKEFDLLKKKIEYSVIDAAGFYENE